MRKQLSPEEHFAQLAEFVKGVELAGGTDSHLTMTAASMKAIDDPLEKLWFAGCYVLCYNWPAAERIFQEWRPEDFNQADFLMWAEENWAGIAMRKERKAVFRKPFFAESASSYLDFARRLVEQGLPSDYTGAYEMFTSQCRYMGRYIAARWIEVMRIALDTRWVMPNPGSNGAEHPRKALAMLYPEDAAALLGGNSPEELRISDLAFDRCLLDLRLEYGLEVDYYLLHSILCEYKQAVLSRKHYPGKSLDSEVVYFDKVYAYWGKEKEAESQFYPIRAAAFPHRSLGEMNGWHGARPELGALIADYGLTWSDEVFEYPKTTDISNPVLRDPAIQSLRDLML